MQAEQTQSQKEQKETKVEFTYPKKPRRDPAKDSSNKKITALCNLRQINLGEEAKKVHHYSIHYEPVIPEDNYTLKRKIINELKKNLTEEFEKYALVGDSVFVFAKNTKEKVALEVTIDKALYKVTLDKTPNYINCGNITSRTRENLKIKSYVESIIKKILMANGNMVQFDNNSFYDYFHCTEITSGKIWTGYSTAVAITENGLFLRLNDKRKLITGKTAYDKIKEISDKYGNIKKIDSQREITEYFKGRKVIATYGAYRAYKIGDISFERNINNTEFEIVKEGKKSKISIKNYYKQQYHIDLKNEDQPILIEEIPKRRKDQEDIQTIRYLIPELVYLTGIDDLGEEALAEIKAKTKLEPKDRVKSIEKGFSLLTNTEKKKIKKGENSIELNSPNEIRLNWGINISDNFLEVEAQCIPVPTIEFKDHKEVPSIHNGQFRQKLDYKPLEFDQNNCMLITFEDLENIAMEDCNQISLAGNNHGVKFSMPKIEKIKTKKKGDQLMNELRKLNYNDGKIIVMVVLDNSTKGLYPFIKDFLYTQSGLTSQFMLHDEILKGGKKKQNAHYYSGVLNQMVVKSKGQLFKIDFPEKISGQYSMIIGIDSTKTKEGIKYVLSASFNKNFNQFYTDIKVDKEDHNALEELLKSALDYFKKVNGENKPLTVIIYRKGGNEKQIEKIVRNELPIITEFFSGVYEDNYKPKLTIFSVNKKTELKFFEKKENNQYSIIPTGTVIDKQVISSEMFEFYLQCPAVEKGSCSPVHFLCLFNNNEDLTTNDYEEITYMQSFYYWNWSGPIKIPAALKYAQVANTFSRKNLIGQVIRKLKDSPYFI